MILGIILVIVVLPNLSNILKANLIKQQKENPVIGEINKSSNVLVESHLIARKDFSDAVGIPLPAFATTGQFTDEYSKATITYNNIPIDLDMKYIIEYNALCGTIGVETKSPYTFSQHNLADRMEITIPKGNVRFIELSVLWYPDGKGLSSTLNPTCALSPTTLDFKLVKV